VNCDRRELVVGWLIHKKMNEVASIKGRLHILHLEDDANDAELIELELQDYGIPCSVTRISTAENFDKVLQDGGIDLILSDSSLPGFDTLSALTSARVLYPEVPFIFVSGTDSPQIKAEAFRHGASNFISKSQLPKLAQAIMWLFCVNGGKPVKTILPEVGMPVIVQCGEFRCLGYLDLGGRWRDYKSSDELPGVIGWSDL
jgi:CheY-like chemotaxis protein